MTVENKDLLSTTEVAELLGISRVAVFQKIQNGQIKAKKVGRNYVIERSDLPGFAQSEELTQEQKKEIEGAVQRTVEEYGETLRLLGEE